jgi:hypothetical protein
MWWMSDRRQLPFGGHHSVKPHINQTDRRSETGLEPIYHHDLNIKIPETLVYFTLDGSVPAHLTLLFLLLKLVDL